MPTVFVAIDSPTTLGRMRRGQTASVTGIDETGIITSLPSGELERRLLEMGFVEGSRVEVLHEGFPGRDPIAVRIGQTVVALRRGEAHAILVA